jgi:flagellar basal body-associated protein FliL
MIIIIIILVLLVLAIIFAILVSRSEHNSKQPFQYYTVSCNFRRCTNRKRKRPYTWLNEHDNLDVLMIVIDSNGNVIYI